MGAKLKMRIDYNVVEFEQADENSEFVEVEVLKDSCAMDGYLRCIEHEISFKGSKTFPLNLDKGQYLSGPIRMQVLCRKFSGANGMMMWLGIYIRITVRLALISAVMSVLVARLPMLTKSRRPSC